MGDTPTRKGSGMVKMPADDAPRHAGVDCVEMPCCGFTFDAAHTDDPSDPPTYTCPLCEVRDLEARLADAREELSEVREYQARDATLAARLAHEKQSAQVRAEAAERRAQRLEEALAPDALAVTIRDVLIEADDCVPLGAEPFVGWSQVLAERIAEAVARRALAGEDTQ